MECKSSHFWLGLGLGSVIGAVVCCYMCKSKAEELKMLKKRLLDTGVKFADKAAEKVDDFKDKAHNFASEMKK